MQKRSLTWGSDRAGVPQTHFRDEVTSLSLVLLPSSHSGLASSWVSKIGKQERGLLPQIPSNCDQKDFGAGWVNTGPNPSSTIRQLETSWTGNMRKRPNSFIPSGISFLNTCIGSLPCKHLYSYFRNGETASVDNRSEPGSHGPLRGRVVEF